MSNNKDFKVKNGIQPTVYQEGVGTVVSAVEGYNLAGASYDSKSFSVSAQDGVPYGLTFNNDGTSMYMLGGSNNTVFQYTLSTAYDVSTASYASKSFSLSSQSGSAVGVAFNDTGTKMYTSTTTPIVHQYDLSTAFDVSTSVYNSVSLTVLGNPFDIIFNGDGSKLYVTDVNGSNVYQYSLSTAYDLSTGSYDNVSLSVVSRSNSENYGIAFNGSGTALFVSSGTNDTVDRYNLTTAYDLSTASYGNITFSVVSQDNVPYKAKFSGNGTKMYISGRQNATIYQYSTDLNTAQLDLSSGSVFKITPTSNIEVQLSNPAASGTSSGATLLLDGAETTGVASTFSTTLYTGNGGTQTITNGIDLAGDGGLVWWKPRGETGNHGLIDTARGATKYLRSNTASTESTLSGTLDSFNSNGFTVGQYWSENTKTFVSWTFKKQAKFFDVVTWTGTGVAGRTVSHSLGSPPGMMIVKSTSLAEPWAVYHKGLNGGTTPQNYHIRLTTGAEAADPDIWNNTAPTSSAFTTGANDKVNANNQTYVAYLFTDNTAPDSLIKCGNYTGNGSATGPVVNLGWEPQWLLIKNVTAYGWIIVDVTRGWSAAPSANVLFANTTAAEDPAGTRVKPTSTGFEILTGGFDYNRSGDNFIYMAIRAEETPTITYNTALKWPSGTAPTSPAIGETDVITFNTTDGGTTYKSALAIDGAK